MDKLWSIIAAENIEVEYDRLWTPTRPLRGFYLSHPEGPLIGLDISLARKCILAEELGHHMTSPRTNAVEVWRNYATVPISGDTVLLTLSQRRTQRLQVGNHTTYANPRSLPRSSRWLPHSRRIG